MTDHIKIPSAVLNTSATTLWVYARLLQISDADGRVSIIAGSWSRSIGVSAQRFRIAITELRSAGCVTEHKADGKPNGAITLKLLVAEPSAATAIIPAVMTPKPPKPVATKQITPKQDIPPSMAINPAFKEPFAAWLAYKKEQFGFRYKSERSMLAAYQSLVKLSDGDPNRAMRIVEQSMSNGWKGLFELKNDEKIITTNFQSAAQRRESDYGRVADASRAMLEAIARKHGQ